VRTPPRVLIDGFSRVLQAETAPFGVKVMVVEPSGFRTDWAGSSMTVHNIPEAYAPTVGAMNNRVRQSTDGPAGDPARAAEILVQVAKRHDIPYHLPLGVNAVEGSIRLDEQLLGRGPQMERREPLRRLQRALPDRVPSRPAEVDLSVGALVASIDVQDGHCVQPRFAVPGVVIHLRHGVPRCGGGAGDRTRVRSRVPCDIYERSPGIDLTPTAPWDQARLRPASVNVPPGAEAPPGGETACINVGSVSHSRGDGRRQAEA
jgi:hypothetical protein